MLRSKHIPQLHLRNRHRKYRKKYKIRNRQSYERSLINRVDLTLWLSEDVIEAWNSDLSRRMGRPKLYSDLAIETALTLRLLFKLPLRQTEGFLKSIFSLMNVGLNVPDHTTLSRSCLLYTSPSPRDRTRSRMPSSA